MHNEHTSPPSLSASFHLSFSFYIKLLLGITLGILVLLALPKPYEPCTIIITGERVTTHGCSVTQELANILSNREALHAVKFPINSE
uniref:Movement protein TGBp3 n=1 Tax=Desert rose mottle virus TaxID=3074535 RepID=A0AA51WBV3_9VIRU|nr:triple gene block protein 3 [Desert rose mottle virus]